MSPGGEATQNVEALAERLGVGSRQLRRLFVEHLGAAPREVLRTQRTHFARQLLDQTRLSMTDVAVAAGFGSVRQFNDAMRKTFGETPSALRQKSGAERPATVHLKLAYRPPYDWPAWLAFMAARAIPGVERVEGERYSRVCAAADGARLLHIQPHDDSHLVLTYEGALGPDLLAHVERVRWLCDLDADPRAIQSVLAKDVHFKERLTAVPGVRVPGAWDGFELAVRAILGQQVSVKAATTLAGRLVDKLGAPLPPAMARPGLTHAFPAPSRVARARLQALGVTQARARALRALATACASGLVLSPAAPDRAAVRQALLALPGIGPWTAGYIAMRALRDPDAFPEGDLGLRQALALEGPSHQSKLPTPKAVSDRLEPFKPWRAYAAMLLWTRLTAGR